VAVEFSDGLAEEFDLRLPDSTFLPLGPSANASKGFLISL